MDNNDFELGLRIGSDIIQMIEENYPEASNEVLLAVFSKLGNTVAEIITEKRATFIYNNTRLQ